MATRPSNSLTWPFPVKTASQFQRVDQGVDLKGPIGPVLAAAPGTIMIAGPDPKGFGNRYPVLVLDQPRAEGRAIYYGHVVPIVPAGTHVSAGTPIATTALGPQGNATQWGWLEIGFWNNGPVGNGAAMNAALAGASADSNPAQGQTAVTFTYAQLECLWTQAGGNAQCAPLAAAIAMAESGGRSDALNTANNNGTVDRGLWQINSSHGTQSTFDIMGNARAAVAISGNCNNFRPWTTFLNKSYLRFLDTNVAPDCSMPINGTNAAANQGATPAEDLAIDCNSWQAWVLTPAGPAQCITGSVLGGAAGTATKVITGILKGIINPFIQFTIGAFGIASGGTIMLIGIWMIARETQVGQGVAGVARTGAMIAAPEATPFIARTGGERAAATRRLAARETAASRAQLQQRRATQQTSERVGRQAASYDRAHRQTRTTVRRQQRGQTTTYVTTREDLRGRAAEFKQPKLVDRDPSGRFKRKP